MTISKNFTSVVITGASSGIGRALALHYAETGLVLGLIGRNKKRLDDCANACRQKGAVVVAGQVDVTDRAAVTSWLSNFDQGYPIDLLIVNAGVSSGMQIDGAVESWAEARRTFDINVFGALNSLMPVAEAMILRRKGQIAVMSSVAAFYPLPSTPAYGASKATLRYYGLALRQALRNHGVNVSVICPGYVVSPMSDRVSGNKPMLISTQRAVAIIARGLERNAALIAFPRSLALGLRLLNFLPPFLARQILDLFALRIEPYSKDS